MEFTYIFVVSCSLALLFTVLIHAARDINIAGSKPFIWQIAFVTVWSVGALMEMLASAEHSMLFWRNFEQIGVFLLPVACVYFAVDYAGYERLKKFLPYFLIIPVAAIILIFTDSTTHIMRVDYIISNSPLFGHALSVRQTPIGMAFVAYNYTLAFISLAILYSFSRRVAKNIKRQVLLVLAATGLIFLFGLLKTVFLEGTGVNIPIVTLYLPGSLILYYNLYRNNLFRVSPIARDKVFDVMEMGILVTDNSGMIADTNPFAIEMLNSFFGIHEKPLGKKMNEVFGVYPQWLELTQNNTAGETEVKTSNGEPCFIDIKVYPLQSKRGTPIGTVTIMRDITILRMQESALKKRAEMDSLTGLLNRESFTEVFAKRLRDSELTNDRVSVLMIDLDKFKIINDTYGHDGGDRVIKAFAEVLREVLRHEDDIARIGGDEFAAILPGVDKKEAMSISERILKTANEKAVQIEEETSIRFTLSIGICDNEVVKTEEELLKCADKAMYMAKNKMGNCSLAWG